LTSSSGLPQGDVTPAARSTLGGKRPIAVANDEEQQTQCDGLRRFSRVRNPEARPTHEINNGASIPAGREVGRQASASGAPHAAERACAAAIDQSALMERAWAMFFGEGERPVATGKDPVAAEATYELVLAVREVVGELWQARETDIRAACAPQLIDEVDVLALVIADALGRPLLHSADRNAVGKRVESCASRLRRVKLPEAKEKARKAAVKARADAEQRAKAMADAEATLLAQTYEGLNLPAATVGRLGKERRTLPTVTQQREAAAAAHVVAEAGAAAANAHYNRALKTLKALPDGAPDSVRARYEERVTAAAAKCDATSDAASAALRDLHAAEAAEDDEAEQVVQAALAAQLAADKAADREDQRQWLLLHEARVAALEDAMAAHFAQAIDAGELTWDDLDSWVTLGESLGSDRSRIRARVVNLFSIIIEHPKADRAPAFIAAATGPSAELEAAERALFEHLTR
jgi:hypothetical protein